jgi:hypothetical protein
MSTMLHAEAWGRGVGWDRRDGVGVRVLVTGVGAVGGLGGFGRITFIKSLLENVTLYGNFPQISSPVLASSLVLECNCVFWSKSA